MSVWDGVGERWISGVRLMCLVSVMSNAHDVLYPSQMRTHSLVKYGEYFKYMDDVSWMKERMLMWSGSSNALNPLSDVTV